ncbi:hypothetical protein HU200_015978 [Digitaria exilis]|uniref:KIB1-4 beta-propeller domain-containing protein n=1 Tax=Digitaria exilis TaxID=1010633 RepID=A0A835F969_9POAL|nr:hypothetical protein HU200_015978 [Digitaria exilis]
MPCCVDWASLPYNIYGRVGERLLADDDIDDFIAFRSTCREWRVGAIADYPENGDYADPTHFQPSKWALLDLKDHHATLLNVDTGRFISKSINLLRDRKYYFIGATAGALILLGELEEPHHALVLNPFTGSIACFKVPVPIPVTGVTAVAVTTAPLMLFVSSEDGEILWADQDSECYRSFFRDYSNRSTCMTSFAGQVYAVNQRGSVLSSAVAGVADDGGDEQSPHSALTVSIGTITPKLDTSPSLPVRRRTGRYYLVVSGGDLLLVTKPSNTLPCQPIVQRVDTERNNKLVPVSSIGNRAIFVGPVRCISIDADKFHGIEGGCVYFVDPIVLRGDYGPSRMDVYQVSDGFHFFVMFEMGTLEGCFRPLTFAQVLADYCRSVLFSELYEMEARERGWDISSDSEVSDWDSEADASGREISSDSEAELSSSDSEPDDQTLSSEPDE